MEENDFAILAHFLDHFEPEVTGHASEPVSDDDAARIVRMARGDLNEAERAELAPLLAANDRAMSLLVAELRKGA
ncbi:MAG: hypothetical protein JNK37_22525 [Verrucomicrobiales bacterium]|nr:hypothetical protein [Verrucomicrobiales bacterium]